ncbi:aminopeptidase M1 [Senna tora]|uniref:Aminopeptidase M1 n=1 Tax=Senna tora TaxID=362788 RepID=A0A834W1M1_9FABA|nr:aminopeptidase M1 [Senna tora]
MRENVGAVKRARWHRERERRRCEVEHTLVEINHSHEIDEIFDAISYREGASVIRMLQSYLGAECFQRSLASYIKRYACSNAKTEDLWAALEEGYGEPVNKLMDSWTKQKGCPVVSVKINNQKLEFEQVLLYLII